MNYDFRSIPAPPRALPITLSEIETAQLIRRLEEDASAFVFKHALVQETTHATLLKNDNKRLHRLVAYALEEVNANRLDEYAAQLAQHFFEAEEAAKALEYAQRAGDNAARVFAHDEALLHYARAIAIAQERASVEQLIYLYTQRGRVLEVIGKYQEALESYRELERYAEARNERAFYLASLTLRAPLHSGPLPTFDGALAKQLLLDALGTARELRDEAAEARVLWNLTLLSTHAGHPEDGLMYGERSLALAEKLDLREQKAYTLHDLFIPYRVNGQTERAREVHTQARALWHELGNKPMLADNLGMAAQFALWEGDMARAVALAEQGVEISRAIGNQFGILFNQSFIAAADLEHGEYDAALRLSSEMWAQTEQGEFNLTRLWILVIRAWLLGQLGAFTRAMEMEQRARSVLTRPMTPLFRSGAYGYLARSELLRGELAAAQADLDAGERDFDWNNMGGPAGLQLPLAWGEYALAQGEYARAVERMEMLAEYVRQHGLRFWLPELLFVQGRAFFALGQTDASFNALQQARSIAEQLGSRRLLWQILTALSNMEYVRGNFRAAEAHQTHARNVLQFIIEHTPSEFRESFLNLPRVREVLAQSEA